MVLVLYNHCGNPRDFPPLTTLDGLSLSLVPKVVDMGKSEKYQSYIELAIDVFKTQDQVLLKSLKDFLTFLPSPIDIEQILAASIYQLAEVDSDSCRWLLRNPFYLMPELDLIDLARKMTFSKLESYGFAEGEDFQLDNNNKLRLSEIAKTTLLEESSMCDRFLLEEIMQINGH